MTRTSSANREVGGSSLTVSTDRYNNHFSDSGGGDLRLVKFYGRSFIIMAFP